MFIYDKEKWLKKIDQVIADGPYKDHWESLSNWKVPEWYQDAKFGMFIHWGIYSVPAYSCEWYSRNMYIQGTKEYEHHIRKYGPQKDFGYKDFIPYFQAEHFDAAKWLDLFEQAGVKYMVPVAEHHDGFQMYDSELSIWNAKNMGPKRNVLGELTEEAEKRGIVGGASTHRIEHWWFMGHGKEFESDITDAEEPGDFYWPAMEEKEHYNFHSQPTPTQEFLEDWMIRTCEIIEKYRIKVLYFDWWIQHESARPYLKKVAAFYYNMAAKWGEEVVICYKFDAFQNGCALVDMERGQFAQARPFYWQSDTAIAKNSWCYTEGNDFKKAKDILCDLVDIVSKNGNMLLNVGPKADGTFSEEDRKVLTEIGAWMKVNGQGIYGTRTWKKAQEGPTKVKEGQFTDSKDKVFTPEDFRFTRKGSSIYAFCLHWPEEDHAQVCIRALAAGDQEHPDQFFGKISKVEILGQETKTKWMQDLEGLHVDASNLKTEFPVGIKITLE